MKVSSQIDNAITPNDPPVIYEHTNFDRYFHFSSLRLFVAKQIPFRWCFIFVLLFSSLNEKKESTMKLSILILRFKIPSRLSAVSFLLSSKIRRSLIKTE